MLKRSTIALTVVFGMSVQVLAVSAEPSPQAAGGAPARIDRVPGHRAAQKDGMPVTPSADTSSVKRDDSIGSYEDCVKNWDSGLHMTKQEWRAVCRRTHPKG